MKNRQESDLKFGAFRMKVTFVADKPASSGCAVIPVKKSLKTAGGASAYVTSSSGQFKKAAKAAGFNGEKGKSFSIFAPTGSDASRLMACGIGDGNCLLYTSPSPRDS